MDKIISINVVCPKCKQSLSKVKVEDMGNDIYKCCSCGEVLVIKKIPSASASYTDGRYCV